MPKPLDDRQVYFAFLKSMHLDIDQGIDRIDAFGEVRDNVINAILLFDLQDEDRQPLGEKSVTVEFYRGAEVLDIPEIIQLVADNIDDAILDAKVNFAGYDPE